MRFIFSTSLSISRVVLLVIAFISILGIAACSKDEDAGISFEITPSDSVLAGDYKLSASLYYPSASESPVDDYALLDSCDRAIIYHFYDSQEYLEESPVDCADNINGNWHVTGTNLVIGRVDILGDTIPTVYPLQSFNLNSFSWKETKPQGDYYIKTFIRQ